MYIKFTSLQPSLNTLSSTHTYHWPLDLNKTELLLTKLSTQPEPQEYVPN